MDLMNGLCHDEFIRALTHLADVLDHPAAAGICRKILAEGLDSLSPAQLEVFKQYIWPHLVEKCATCPTLVPAGVDYCPVCAIKYAD
ncbi:hypothetical protein [Pseudomonas protegens]|uniref:hypothetical protein n=1 Tax=Pseudomonas protegens TaxID=380021 RepID=UPI0011429767|nr:hypothetical protein [Pseudomonas protegens]